MNATFIITENRKLLYWSVATSFACAALILVGYFGVVHFGVYGGSLASIILSGVAGVLLLLLCFYSFMNLLKTPHQVTLTMVEDNLHVHVFQNTLLVDHYFIHLPQVGSLEIRMRDQLLLGHLCPDYDIWYQTGKNPHLYPLIERNLTRSGSMSALHFIQYHQQRLSDSNPTRILEAS